MSFSIEQKHGHLLDNSRGILMLFTVVSAAYITHFLEGPHFYNKEVLTALHLHTSSLSSSVNLSVDHNRALRASVVHLPRDRNRRSGRRVTPCSGPLAPIWRTTQYWSWVSLSAESSSLEHDRRNGNVQHRASQTMMMMTCVYTTIAEVISVKCITYPPVAGTQPTVR